MLTVTVPVTRVTCQQYVTHSQVTLQAVEDDILVKYYSIILFYHRYAVIIFHAIFPEFIECCLFASINHTFGTSSVHTLDINETWMTEICERNFQRKRRH